MTIAQQFTAGMSSVEMSVCDADGGILPRISPLFSRPLHGLGPHIVAGPSDESLGYFQSSADRGLGPTFVGRSDKSLGYLQSSATRTGD